MLATPQRKSTHPEVPCLKAFISPAGGNLRGGLRGGFKQNIHQFSRCSLSGSWSPMIGQCQGRVFSHYSWFGHCPPGFAVLGGLELKYN